MTENTIPETASERRRIGRSGIDPKMLELLVCPLTKARLVHDREQDELVSEAAGLAYPIRDGIPIMLVSEARQLES